MFCRKHEEDLAKAHQKEVDSLVADHLRETQALLTEFNRAKELLSDKISALQLMLVPVFKWPQNTKFNLIAYFKVENCIVYNMCYV